jgi:amino acid permease
MEPCENCEAEGRPVVALIFTMALVFIAYFGLRAATPELPLHVLRALALLPT